MSLIVITYLLKLNILANSTINHFIILNSVKIRSQILNIVISGSYFFTENKKKYNYNIKFR